jgi:rhodanese-related sulfurtransferase
MFVPLNPTKAQELIASGAVEVIDVRDPGEWHSGHIAGARLVSLSNLRANVHAHVNHDGVLFVCAGGVRSQTAARLATEMGFKQIYSLVGGTRSWVKAGLPLVQKIDVAV